MAGSGFVTFEASREGKILQN